VTVVWIETKDIATAKQLVQHAVCAFGGESVMLTAVADVVRLRLEFPSSAAAASVVEGIESWLSQTGIEAQISLDLQGEWGALARPDEAGSPVRLAGIKG